MLALVSACSMNPTPASPGPQESTPGPQPSRFITTEPLPSASVPSGTPATLSAPRLAAIQADLRTRGVAPEAVQVISAENVTFNDGSLGCPAPGQQYTQAQVEGTRVVVEAAGTQYDYRFGTSDTPHLCQNGPAATSSTR